MSLDDQKLEIEITIDAVKGRRGGQRRKAAPNAPDPPRIPRITRLMALAVKFQDMVDRGVVRDYADLARLGYVSRARITQIMNLLNLAPDVQERILFFSDDRRQQEHQVRERAVRPLAQVVEWDEQRRQLGTFVR